MRLRPPDPSALVVVGAGAVLALASGVVAVPPFLPIGNYPEFSATTPRADILLAPVMHAPWFGRVSLAVAIVVSVAVLACLWMASRRLGAGAGPAAAIVFAAAARPEFATALAVAAAPVSAMALTWVAVAAASRRSWPGHAPATAWAGRSWAAALMAAVAAAGATLAWPPAIVFVPLVVAGAAAARNWRALAPLAVAAAVGLAGGAAAWAARASAMAGEAVTVAEVAAVAGRTAAAGEVPYPWPPLTAMLLPLALAVAGAIVAWRVASGRAAWVVGAAGALTLLAALPAWRLELTCAIAWGSWPLAAVGLTWLVDRASPPRRGVVLAALAVVLIGSGLLGRVRRTELVEPRAFAAALEVALDAEGSVPAIVAEDPRVDTALVAWGGARLRRVRPVAELVEASAAGGGPVLAGPAARAALELWGLRFTAGPSVWAPVPFGFGRVSRGFHCVEVGRRWNELPGIDYTGRLGVHVPAGAGHLEVVVVGPEPLDVRTTSGDGRRRGVVTTSAIRDLAELPPVLWPGDGRLPADGTALARADVAASADAPVDLAIALGARAPLVGARMVGGTTATVCAAPLPRPDPFERLEPGGSWRVPLDDDAYIGAGWRPLASDRTGDARVTDRAGVILIPSSGARTVAITADVALGDAPPGTARRVVLAVNGRPVAAREVTASGATLEALVPSMQWLDGTNEIALTLAPGPGDATVAGARLVVRDVRLSAP